MPKKIARFGFAVLCRLLCGEMVIVAAFSWVAFWSHSPVLVRFIYGALVVAYFSYLLHQLTCAGRRYFAE